MTKSIYHEKMYDTEFEAEVVSVKDKYVILNQTLFYPNSGGVECDTGIITTEKGDEYNVIFTGKFNGEISHEVDKLGLEAGTKIKGKINWDRRYKLMRYHSAAHVLCAIFAKEANVQITGNKLTLKKGRIDFSLENFDKSQMQKYFDMANKIIDKDLKISAYYLSREEVIEKNLGYLAKGLLDNLTEMRIIDIENFDAQPDGGAHVRSLKEIGHLKFLKADNKGAKNRRVYFSIE